MDKLDEIKRSIERMSVDEIAPIVRAAVRDDSAVVESDWAAAPMSVTSAGNGTLGFFRVDGNAKVDGAQLPWSSVVKVLDPDDFSAGSSRIQNARNELDALQAPELGSVGTGMRLVPIHGLVVRPDNIYWLWMKDLSGGTSPPWDVETYTRVARDVGEFNALWPEESRPDGTWITTDPSASRSEQAIREMPGYYEILRSNKDHPLVLGLTADLGINNIFSLLDDARIVVEATRNLPRYVAHQDCHARNLFPWTEEDGLSVTYAVDWASVGIAPLGADAGSLTGGGFSWGQAEADMIASHEVAIFDSYVQGLADSGWRGEVDDVRLGYLGQVSSYIIMLPFFVTMLVSDGSYRQNFLKRRGVDENTAVMQSAERIQVFRPLLDEALTLADQLG